ncbi:hypothetical protein NIES3585_32900 [Nodularia sp. NIES-3585]|nr:hypothetical protein NIES3585_32900 [Nodularia sp. NIES-3585]
MHLDCLGWFNQVMHTTRRIFYPDFSRDVEKAILTFSQALIFSLAIVIA